MKTLLIATLLLSLIAIGTPAKGEITIFGHRWCKKSKLAYDIVKKIEPIYGEELTFTYHIENGTVTSSMTFPTIRIACLNQTTIYEN